MVQGDCEAWGSPKSDVNQGAFWGVNLDHPSAKPALEGVEVLLEVKGCYGGVLVGRQHGTVICPCGEVCGDIGGVQDVEGRRKDTSLGRPCLCREVRREG